MKKITDKDVERLKAGKKITKGFIHMQLDDKGRLNLWSDINITSITKSRYTYRDLLRLGDRQDMYKGKSKTFS